MAFQNVVKIDASEEAYVGEVRTEVIPHLVNASLVLANNFHGLHPVFSYNVKTWIVSHRYICPLDYFFK
jgi:hypothetical protein